MQQTCSYGACLLLYALNLISSFYLKGGQDDPVSFTWLPDKFQEKEFNIDF